MDNYKERYSELRHFFVCYFSEYAGYIDENKRLNYEEIMNQEVISEYSDFRKKEALIKEIEALLLENHNDTLLKQILIEAFHAADLSNMMTFLNVTSAREVLLDIKKRMELSK